MLISEATLNILSKMDQILSESFNLKESIVSFASPGAGEAENPETSAEDKLDTMMVSTLEALLDEFEVDEEEAVDFIFYVADELADDGQLPPFPDEAATPDEVAAWVGGAGMLGFTGLVLACAEEEVEGEYDEDLEEDHDCGCGGHVEDCDCDDLEEDEDDDFEE